MPSAEGRSSSVCYPKTKPFEPCRQVITFRIHTRTVSQAQNHTFEAKPPSGESSAEGRVRGTSLPQPRPLREDERRILLEHLEAREGSWLLICAVGRRLREGP